ncbi:hypothetical protein FRB90_004292 [Tulasnella sp. 427]|nr:hypothetical protein FRB90_004292 [Tulasnella sp. 427]
MEGCKSPCLNQALDLVCAAPPQLLQPPSCVMDSSVRETIDRPHHITHSGIPSPPPSNYSEEDQGPGIGKPDMHSGPSSDVNASETTSPLRNVSGAATIFRATDRDEMNEAVDSEGKLVAFEIPCFGKNWKPTYIRRCQNSKFHVWEPIHGDLKNSGAQEKDDSWSSQLFIVTGLRTKSPSNHSSRSHISLISYISAIWLATSGLEYHRNVASVPAGHPVPGFPRFTRSIPLPKTLGTLIFKSKQIVLQTVANEENAFQLVTPRPFRRSIRRLRLLFILRTLLTPVCFASGPVLAYTLGTGLKPHSTNLGILTLLCLSTVVHPIAAWYTYRLGERAKVKDFAPDYREANRSFEMTLALGSSVAGILATVASPLVLGVYATMWVTFAGWTVVRNAREALFPRKEELETSLVDLTKHFDGSKSDSINLGPSDQVSSPDTPCKACAGPSRVVEKSQLPDLPDTDFSRSFSRAFDEAVKRELAMRRQVNAEYD